MPRIGTYLNWKDYEKFKRRLEELGLSEYYYLRKLIFEDIHLKSGKRTKLDTN